MSFYRHPRLAILSPCNLAESPLQNGPYQRNHTHSLQQSDATHQKSKGIQCREATAWVRSKVCTHEANKSNSTCKGWTPRRFQPTSSRHYISAKNMRYRSNLYTTKQVPTPPHIQGGERTERSPESICMRSQSVPIGPIEGQKFDPHEQKYWVYQSISTNRTCFSAIDHFITFPYTYMTTSKNTIGGRVDK